MGERRGGQYLIGGVGAAVKLLVMGLSLTFIFVNIGRPMPTRIGFLKMTSWARRPRTQQMLADMLSYVTLQVFALHYVLVK